MSTPPILSINMVPGGVELVLHALSKLPYEQCAGLIREIEGQANQQLQAIAQMQQQQETLPLSSGDDALTADQPTQ